MQSNIVEVVTLDFMFGLPGQAPATWARTLSRALTLAPEHLSLYSLTVEHGTPLFDQVRRGLVAEPDDDQAADFYLAAGEMLAAGGYEQYEISNWARGGAWPIADGRWPMADGKWPMADGRWRNPHR